MVDIKVAKASVDHLAIEVECEFVTMKRGARSLVQGGFKYTLNRPGRKGQTYWRCVDRNCPGRGVTDENNYLVSTY